MNVFVVQHMYLDENGGEQIKLIGVYQSSLDAMNVIEKLKCKPGFKLYPNLVISESEGAENGFYIEEYNIGKVHWQDGFGFEE